MNGTRLTMVVGAVAIAAALGMSGTAAAGNHHHHGGGHGYGHSHGGYRGGFSIGIGSYGYGGYGGYGGGYGYYPQYRQPVYHDTTHYDYHPTTVVPHGNHYHVIPGHYDLHRTGHWHY